MDMMLRFVVFTACALLAGCASRPADSPETAREVDAPPTVWAVDLVRTLPGAQADYLASIETNWASARALAKQGGAVVAYRAFAAEPDSARGWDVLLMTGYADSTAWARREDTFQTIFAAPGFVYVQPSKPSEAMRTFASGGTVMRAFVSEP